jgi:hypothetical protein
MTWPLGALAAGGFAAGLLAPWVFRAAGAVLRGMEWLPDGAGSALADSEGLAWGLCLGSALLVGLSAAAFFGRVLLLRGRRVGSAVTWDCGYAAPTARMQYTASSFGEPLTGLFRAVVRPGQRARPPRGLFAEASEFSSAAKDLFRGRVFAPAFRAVGAAAGRLRWLQQGRTQLYVLYVALTALALLLWRL